MSCPTLSPSSSRVFATLQCFFAHNLAGEDAGPGNLVVGDGGPVDADLDSGVGSLFHRGG